MQWDNTTMAITGVLLVSAIAIFMCLKNMKPGFGPNNLRVLGILLVASFSTVLALVAEGSVSSAMGILGAIAGYLFGLTTGSSDDAHKQ